MNIEGIIAVFGIVLSLLAIANPVQRKSIFIFIPIKVICILFIISFGIVIWRYSVPVLGYIIFPIADLITYLIVIIFQISIFIISIIRWNNSIITSKNMEKFKDLLLTSKNEKKFDEVIRILNKNGDLNLFSDEVINLLYQPDVIQEINHFPDWISLKLIKNDFKSLNNRFYISENLMRDLVEKDNSIIKKYVVSKYGGVEHQNFTNYERDLIEETIADPHWYIDIRADYPLVVKACEETDKELIIKKYNTNDNLYLNSQGRATRVDCPIYTFIKIHYLVLSNSIRKKVFEKDFYVSDLYNIFKEIINSINSTDDVWNYEKNYHDYPTPFYFLVNEILTDILDLARSSSDQGQKIVSSIAERVLSIWFFCIFYMYKKKESVKDEFVKEKVIKNIEFILSIHDQNKKYNHEWKELYFKSINTFKDPNFIDYFIRNTADLDLGKDYIFNSIEWFKNELTT